MSYGVKLWHLNFRKPQLITSFVFVSVFVEVRRGGKTDSLKCLLFCILTVCTPLFSVCSTTFNIRISTSRIFTPKQQTFLCDGEAECFLQGRSEIY